MTTFHDLGVDDALCRALDGLGINEPFAIQSLTIPLALEGADVIGQARTGTGKTLAFGLPLLQRIEHGTSGVHALVVTPTRELAAQVAEDLEQAGKEIDARVVSVYGGVPIDPQERALQQDRADIVVGTPGRLLDHVRRGNLDLSGVHILVLDEADRMLDMGFVPDVETIVDLCRDERQTLLFSATMPPPIVALARRYMDRPTFIRAEEEEPQVAPETRQHFFVVHRMDKPRVLARILQDPTAELATVFVRTKRMADRLVDELRQWGVNATPIHGDLRQSSRERNLERFRAGKNEVLVATEVAARGLDIDRVTHVVNYDCPDDEHMYLHRIGRTGRAGAAGVAVTFAEANEMERVNMIRRAIGFEEPAVEVFSTSPELRETFDLPEATPWDHLSTAGATHAGAASEASTSRRRGGVPHDRKEDGGDRGGSRNGRKRDGGGRGGSPSGRKQDGGGPGGSPSGRKQDGGGRGGSSNGRKQDEGERGDKRSRSRRSERAEDAPPSSRQRTRTRAAAPSDADGPARTRVRRREDPQPAADESERTRSSQRRKPEPQRGSNGGGRRRNRDRTDASDRRGGSDRQPAAEAAPTPSESPRGDGVPRLSRRLEVEHLP